MGGDALLRGEHHDGEGDGEHLQRKGTGPSGTVTQADTAMMATAKPTNAIERVARHRGGAFFDLLHFLYLFRVRRQ